MKEIKRLAIIIAVLTLVFPVVGLTESPPPIPLLVYGNITIDGQSAPLDTEISAKIEEVEVAVATMIKEGIYFIEIPDGKVNEGKIIIFKVNGITDDNNQRECVNIDTIPSIRFDLAIITPSPPAPSTPPSGGGGGGGGGSTTPLPTDYEIGDTNKDGKVDKYDFSLMMADWGKTGTNNSDLNNDNKVDKYDFALLMLDWSTI